MTRLQISSGDIAHTRADALVASANPWLRLTGGVGAALEPLAPSLREELQAHLDRLGVAMVPPATVVSTGPVEGHFRVVFHAVAIDGHYKSSPELVRGTLLEVFSQCRSGGFRSLALPALATGYGKFPMIDFLLILRELLPESGLEEVELVLSRPEWVEQAQLVFGIATPTPVQGMEPVSPAWRLLLMVEVLHSWGYEKVRIRPEMAGSEWRCSFGGAHYRSAEGECFFDWSDAAGFTSGQLATCFLARFPALAEAGRGSDSAYAAWYQGELLRNCGADNLPVGSRTQRGQTLITPPAG